MNDSIDEFHALLPPPQTPDGLDYSWEYVEKQLGVSLPSDYKEFIDCYGTARLCEFIVIWNMRDSRLFTEPFLDHIVGKHSILSEYEMLKARGVSGLDCPLFPERGGLLPFASILDVDYVQWNTEGEPDAWDIVYWYSDGGEFFHLEGDSFSAFLLKLLRKEYATPEIPKFDEPYSVVRFHGR